MPAKPEATQKTSPRPLADLPQGPFPTAWLWYVVARRAFRSDAELADVLGVNRSQIARWKRGGKADPENEARLRDLEIAVSLLMEFLEARAIGDWLKGFNAHLDHRRPIDVLMAGRLSEVVACIEAEKSGAFA